MPAKTPPATRTPQSITDQLKAFLLTTGSKTGYGAAKAAGVTPIVVARFIRGERSLNLGTVDRLADVLGLQLIQTAKPRVAKVVPRAVPKRATVEAGE